MRLAELAQRLGTTLDGDGDVEIDGVAPIDEARSGDVTFVANPKYRRLLAQTEAAAVIVGRDDDGFGRTVLRADDPHAAFVRALAIFDDRPVPSPGVHPTAVVSESAEIGPGAYIGPYAVIGDHVAIGSDAKVHPHVVIYPRARIGDRFVAHAGAVVRECVRIGDDVSLQPGAVVGGDGFGFLPTGGVPLAVPQIGTVEVGDDVDIGSNTTVDRAAGGATRLGRGVKLDNLVMIAHGCKVGEGALMAGQSGVAGSSTIGKYVMAGGQVGVSGHLAIGDRVQLAAQSGIVSDIAPDQVVGGTPAVPIGLWRRVSVLLRSLPGLVTRVKRLEEKVAEMSSEAND